ncbi:nitrate/nitrite transporter [Siccirubricoccus sp. G192]|uniref:MFS transporter n=1 Tax=Siccirubricoccus sp. G192 TaxID=2849651 RepID=UPI001C2C6935|nr:nitrate/nitrite transporter [Siccirubricoccus sp. G192]MBV1798041.1 NarK/NasA family nitrate transporter [Siccirubricoccus sp. G192]
MSTTVTPVGAARPGTPGGTWLDHWEPENPAFWAARGSKVAWRSLGITTFNLTLAFIIWFVVSALVVRLPGLGFKLTTSQLFWLAAMPGLAGGTLRILHTFLTPMLGARHVVTLSTLSLLVPALGWFYAVQDPTTPYWVLILLAFLAGLGGGNFSSFMPATSLFFPKRLAGTALAIQAGIGNFGVSVVQFVTPWVIGFALADGLLGEGQSFNAQGGATRTLWLQNATAIYVPLILLGVAAAWFALRSVPVRANFREQLDIFSLKHGLIMTVLYIMTFGIFSGMAAVFPLLIKQCYGALPGAPDPLTYAFLGPLVGSVARIAGGPIADRFGGARVTQVAGIGMLACTLAVPFYTSPDSMADFSGFLASMLGLFFFSGIGNASTFKQMPMLFPPRQAGGVIGWTGAMAAYGPFACGMLIGQSIAFFGTPNAFFWWCAVYFTVCIGLNWWFYARRNAPNPC